MTNEEAIRELKAMYEHILPHMSIMGTEALEMGIKALEKQENNFNEVVDFFNDIMDTLYKDLAAYDISTESIRYARNRVYDVFSRRYRIKELESNITIKENERNEKN